MKYPRLFAAALAIALFLTSGVAFFPVSAEDTDGEVVNTSSEIPDEVILAGFETGVDGFSRSDNVKAVEAITVSDGSRNCLEAVGYDVDVNLVRTVIADLGVLQAGTAGVKEPLDLSEYQRVACDIYVPAYEADPDAEYFLRITLNAADGTTSENIVGVSPDEWTTVGIDISGFPGRDELISAGISLLVSTSVHGTHRNSFYVDELRADEKIDRSHTKRFMLDRLNVTGGQASYGEDSLEITLSGDSQTSVSGTVFPTIPDWEVSSLRFRIENYSELDSMIVSYTSSDGGISEDRSVSVRLEKNSVKSYYVDVGDISKLSSLTMNFGAGNGNITITSICPVSQYVPTTYKTCGNITGCYLTDDLLSVRFTGDVGREEVLSNQSGRLYVYAIEPGEKPSEVDFSQLTPIAESPMTTKFDLSVSLTDAGEDIVTKQFVALSKRQDDSFVLIDSPFYIENPERGARYSVAAGEGKKGVVASDISLLGELRADTTILTVDVSQAFSERTSGESFACRGATYYMNQDYFSKLSSKIDALYGAGIGVTLRLVGWNEAFAEELSGVYALERYNFYAEYNSTPDGNDFLAALGVYIAEKYCADGKVTGLILGECENFIGKIEGQNDSLTEMANRLATSLRTLYYAVAFVNSETKVYLSISNLYSNELSAESPEIGAEEFIPALCAEINLNGNFNWGLCVEDFYRFVDYGDRTMSAADADSLISLLRNSGVYDTRLIFRDSNYSFSDLKSTDRMVRAVESFYAAFFGDHVDAVYFELPSNADSRLCEATRFRHWF